MALQPHQKAKEFSAVDCRAREDLQELRIFVNRARTEPLLHSLHLSLQRRQDGPAAGSGYILSQGQF